MYFFRQGQFVPVCGWPNVPSFLGEETSETKKLFVVMCSRNFLQTKWNMWQWKVMWIAVDVVSKSTYSLIVTLFALESRPSQSLCLNLFLFAIHFVPKHISTCKTAGNLLQLAVQCAMAAWYICCSSNIAMNLLYPRHRLRIIICYPALYWKREKGEHK